MNFLNSLQKLKITVFISLALIAVPTVQASSHSGPELEIAGNNISNQASLRHGAELFGKKCMTCHSVKYMRYNRIAKDLGWTNEEVLKAMGKTKNRAVDTLKGGMSDSVAKMVFHTKIPDLSLMARLKGPDYIYSFLRGFEVNKETGKMDNKFLPGTKMPNIMPRPKDEAGMAKYNEDTRDLVNFLEYVSEPSKLQRHALGWKVLLFLFIMFIFAYLLKREYWKDIKH